MTLEAGFLMYAMPTIRSGIATGTGAFVFIPAYLRSFVFPLLSRQGAECKSPTQR
jgi:hypothetical protein